MKGWGRIVIAFRVAAMPYYSVNPQGEELAAVSQCCLTQPLVQSEIGWAIHKYPVNSMLIRDKRLSYVYNNFPMVYDGQLNKIHPGK